MSKGKEKKLDAQIDSLVYILQGKYMSKNIAYIDCAENLQKLEEKKQELNKQGVYGTLKITYCLSKSSKDDFAKLQTEYQTVRDGNNIFKGKIKDFVSSMKTATGASKVEVLQDDKPSKGAKKIGKKVEKKDVSKDKKAKQVTSDSDEKSDDESEDDTKKVIDKKKEQIKAKPTPKVASKPVPKPAPKRAPVKNASDEENSNNESSSDTDSTKS